MTKSATMKNIHFLGSVEMRYMRRNSQIFATASSHRPHQIRPAMRAPSRYNIIQPSDKTMQEQHADPCARPIHPN